MAKILVEVKPAVMEWLFTSSGWEKEELAKRLSTSIPNLENILSGEKKLSWRQLELLSNAFKRPIAAFLLPKPTDEKIRPKDYRMIPNRTDKFDKKTILAMRKARFLQESARDLLEEEKLKPPDIIKQVSLSEDPIKLAEFYRNEFHLTKSKVEEFKSPYKMLKYLRELFEELNVFVFQFSMPVEDARGFNYIDEYPYVIVINSADLPVARIFSLLHEFGHILLGESVVDLAGEILEDTHKQAKFEKWCNEFASNILIPNKMAKSLFDLLGGNLTSRTTLTHLSNKYKVSKHALLLKMLKLGYINETDYTQILNQYKLGTDVNSKSEKEKEEDETSGGPSIDKKCVARLGEKFISLVANNVENKKITYSEALDFLSIKSKHYEKVLARTKK